VSARFAIVLGVVFVAVGSIYWFVQHYDLATIDYAGATMLVVLGVAMAFGFTVLLRGSREL
jgi:predicted phage tail protein